MEDVRRSHFPVPFPRQPKPPIDTFLAFITIFIHLVNAVHPLISRRGLTARNSICFGDYPMETSLSSETLSEQALNITSIQMHWIGISK